MSDIRPIPKRIRFPLTIRGKRSSSWHRSRQWCFDRASGRCQARIETVQCTGRAEHAHHVVLRSQGGSDDIDNLLAVCNVCHRYIHDHPAWSYVEGFLRHREVS